MAQQFLCKVLFAAILCVLLCQCYAAEDDDILELDVCSLQSCMKPSPSSKDFIQRCNSDAGLTLKGHCCVNLSSDKIMGIDLSYCHLKNIKTIFHRSTDVLRINLTHNSNLTFGNTSFLGLKKLKMVILDLDIDCPGEWNWFNKTWKAWNVTDKEKHAKRCINQTDTCALLQQEHNYTCPVHSNCVNNGPGHFSCLCEDGWGGYRCLRLVDSHLTIPILSGVAGATILASGFLWYTQRRHVI